MSKEVTIKFWPVGQGLFHTIDIGNFHIVYDVGTSNRQSQLTKCIDKYLTSINNEPIDIVIISHLHKDHMSGLQYLFQKSSHIKKLIFPYLDNKGFKSNLYQIILLVNFWNKKKKIFNLNILSSILEKEEQNIFRYDNKEYTNIDFLNESTSININKIASNYFFDFYINYLGETLQRKIINVIDNITKGINVCDFVKSNGIKQIQDVYKKYIKNLHPFCNCLLHGNLKPSQEFNDYITNHVDSSQKNNACFLQISYQQYNDDLESRQFRPEEEWYEYGLTDEQIEQKFDTYAVERVKNEIKQNNITTNRYLKHKHHFFLLTGDIEKIKHLDSSGFYVGLHSSNDEFERWIARKGQFIKEKIHDSKNKFASFYCQLPHHGAYKNYAYMNEVLCAYVFKTKNMLFFPIINYGIPNKYGHPNPISITDLVLSRWWQKIIFVTNKNNGYWIKYLLS